MAGKSDKNGGQGGPPTISNRRAYHDYLILEEIEAGIALIGCEVKMIRQGNMQIADAYAEIREGEVWLINSTIPPFPQASTHEKPYEPLRRRKLLLHRQEIAKLRRKVIEKGLTLVPLKAYFQHGRVKVLIGLVRGKKQHDKRDSIKERDVKRDTERAAAQH
jgi:SsrA-binding protein